MLLHYKTIPYKSIYIEATHVAEYFFRKYTQKFVHFYI